MRRRRRHWFNVELSLPSLVDGALHSDIALRSGMLTFGGGGGGDNGGDVDNINGSIVSPSFSLFSFALLSFGLLLLLLLSFESLQIFIGTSALVFNSFESAVSSGTTLLAFCSSVFTMGAFSSPSTGCWSACRWFVLSTLHWGNFIQRKNQWNRFSESSNFFWFVCCCDCDVGVSL